NPSNIIYNRRTGIVKVIDFGIATRAHGTNADAGDIELLEGSLPYISPEQTGRVNRSVDHRADFYSLGVTLYEWLTQRPLFFVREHHEWLHCHIAKPAVAPIRIVPDIPDVVSDLVLKLLAKNP